MGVGWGGEGDASSVGVDGVGRAGPRAPSPQVRAGPGTSAAMRRTRVRT